MPRKVLVADDSVTIQKVVGITFASEDIALSFVDNGEEAIELARKIKPDLIIADVLMPRKSGYEVCEAIKQDPELSGIPVLLLTGTFEPFDAERSRRVGADGTITKPFESQTLIRQVNELLDRAAPPVRRDAPAPAPTSVETLAPPPTQDEAESAFADLSRDLELEPLATAAEETAEPGGPVDEAFDFEFESTGHFSAGEDAAPAAGVARVEPSAGAPRLSEREDEFEFVQEPGEVLELGVPTGISRAADPQVEPERPYGAGEPPASDLFADARVDETGDVWDLSDLEAVEESAVAEPDTPAGEAESPSFWDDAAAEAIDLVESVSVDAPEELLLSGEDAIDGGASELVEAADLDLPLTRIDDGAAPTQSAGTSAEPLHPSLEDLPEFDFDAEELGEPLDVGEPLDENPGREPGLEPFSIASPPPPLAVEQEAEGASTVASMADLGDTPVEEVVRRAVNDTVERVTWEAFSDLSETVVKAVKEKVEQIAWEVIPQMAESLIREEIKRIQSEEKK